MTPAVEQLVRETMELTGVETPMLLEDDAPVLSDEALEAAPGIMSLTSAVPAGVPSVFHSSRAELER